MNSKWHGEQCPVCFKGTLADGVKDEKVTYQGAVFQYKQAGAYCSNCGDGIVTGDIHDDEEWVGFRAAVDATIAKEMETIRNELHLSKSEVADLVGGGKNGFTRYVNQETRPTPAVWNLMRAMHKHPELVDELREPIDVSSLVHS